MSLFGVQVIIEDMVKLFCQLLIVLCRKMFIFDFQKSQFCIKKRLFKIFFLKKFALLKVFLYLCN